LIPAAGIIDTGYNIKPQDGTDCPQSISIGPFQLVGTNTFHRSRVETVLRDL
jgi:hypothetical protein